MSTPSLVRIGRLIQLADAQAGSTAVVAPERGGLVTSFAVEGRELLFMDASTLADLSKNVRGGIPVLFPSPGKLECDAWRYGPHSGSMAQHGFARTLPWTVQATGPYSTTLELASNGKTLAQFPWPFRMELRIVLNGLCLRLETTVINTGAEAMPFALGFHPYFHVADKSRARIPSAATRAFDNVSKAVTQFGGCDLSRSELDMHLLDHPDHEAVLELPHGSIIVRAGAEFRRWVVWTLAGRDFVCLEPWTAPGNAFNTGEHLIVLPAGASHTSRVEIEYRPHG